MSGECVRVLQVYKDFYPPVCGGIERHIYDLVSGLPRWGAQCDVLVAGRRPQTREEAFAPAGNGAQPSRVVKVGEFGRVLSAPLAPGFVHWLRRLAPQYDVVHFHFPNPTAEIAWLLSGARVPALVTYHNDIVRQRVSGALYRPVLQRFLARMQRIVVSSPPLLANSAALRALRNKCSVIPFGVDVSRFDAPELLRAAADWRAQLTGDETGACLALFVGKFRYYKGLPILLDALGMLRAQGVPVRGVLVGDGPEEPALRARVRQLGLEGQVEFPGERTGRELAALYHAADVFVLPSVERSESFGLVLLEAMACGKPVISTELGTGTSWVNQHEVTGLVIPPRDGPALAQALKQLATGPVMRRIFGENARRRVQTSFRSDQMLKSIFEQYRALCPKRVQESSSALVEAGSGH
ncbi:MAG TPA: glycosyltransferase [Candidatus Nitrosotenuis sp.]|nr:glycosyltransferase [Candidatus Nitrosotenuis sp.]